MKSGNIRNKGFTLVELSIVIVIIGLIIAGVTAGQSLVKGSQLRAIITQADQVRSAVNAFKLQYNGYPGDLSNGYTYWSTAPTNCTSTAACNGDGNKQISIALKASNTSSEANVAWWELNAAGVFPGTYTTPNTTNATVTGTIGTTIPAAKYTGAGITLGYGSANLLTSTTSGASGTSKNLILFGFPATGAIAYTAFLTPAQAASIDTKADDGSALTGSTYGGNTAAAVLSATSCATTAGVYNLSLTTSQCTIGFAL